MDQQDGPPLRFCKTCKESHRTAEECRGYPVCARCGAPGHLRFACPLWLAAIMESKKTPVAGTNGQYRYKDCTYCKLHGHTTNYCAEKYNTYPDMKRYVEKFPGEEAVYEAINENVDLMGKMATNIGKLLQKVEELSNRVERLEQKRRV